MATWLRAAAAWVLCLATLLAPFGVWASNGCGDACPCDAEVGADHAHHDHHEHEVLDGHDASAKDDAVDDASDERRLEVFADGSDDCPDDCPDCRCEAGVALAVSSIPSSELSRGLASPLPQPELLRREVDGTDVSIFRPPRSRA